MAIAPGYTDEEVRAYVYEYERQPWGTRQAWLDEQGISRDRFRRWRDTVFDGDLDRGLVPRESSRMTSPNQRRRLAKQHDKVVSAAEAERLHARIRELEASNEPLGKAIGLLHQLNEQEPDTSATSEPNDS